MRPPRTSIGLLIAALAVAPAALTVSGSAAAAAADCSALRTAAHESINRATTATLITPWADEANGARTKYGFGTSRGTPFKVSTEPATGLAPVSRLYNGRTHDFRYVWKKSEKRSLLKKGYRSESAVFYAAKAPASCVRPVYRYLRKGVTQYAFSAKRRRKLKKHGWRYDKVAFYASPMTSSPALPPARRPAWRPDPQAPTKGPLAQPLYVNHTSLSWRAYSQAKSRHTKRLLYQVAATPTAIWLGGASGDRTLVNRVEKAASARGKTPEFVLYAIPNRDCGGYSAGGLDSVSAYENWVDSVRAGIAERPSIVIVEPDAIGMSCLSAQARADRIAMLRYAMRTLAEDANTWVYIHGGSGLPTATFAPILKQVGVQYGRGIAVNVSSFSSTAKEKKYSAHMLAALRKIGVTGKHAVIDTSRNGLGSISAGANGGAPGWCNPPGRALGKRPTTDTGSAHIDAFLWIKPPGESDGQCHRGDPKGWFQSYALDITQRALDRKIIKSLRLPN